jgi:serine/threonine protein phosphatase PrpC
MLTWLSLNRRSKKLDGEWLTASPDTSSMLVPEDAEFVILASDGLWDSLKRYKQRWMLSQTRTFRRFTT